MRREAGCYDALSVNTQRLCFNSGIRKNGVSTSVIFLKAALSFSKNAFNRHAGTDATYACPCPACDWASSTGSDRRA